MPRRFEAATLVGSPHCPNAVAWSDENLVAVASGYVVTILKPATAFGPRGLVTLPPSKPFPIGVIDRQDLLSPCLLPTCLSREVQPRARSISWSPIGFAPNAGCLLAVCTTDGRVKVYCMPYSEFSSEWIEVMDISEMLHSYLASVNFFEEPELLSSGIADNSADKTQVDQSSAEIQLTFVSRQEKRPRRQKALTVVRLEPQKPNKDKGLGSGEKRRKQTEESCNLPLITAEQFASRSTLLSSLIVAWSPILLLTAGVEETFADNPPSHCSLLAVAGKSGRISLWRFDQPPCYTNLNSRQPIPALLIGLLEAHDVWITALSWELSVPDDASDPLLLLATGSSNGSVKIWKAYVSEVMKSSETNFLPFYLLKEVVTINCGIVSVLSIFLPLESPGKVLLAIGRGSGLLEVWIGDLNSNKFEREGCLYDHDHMLTGLAWAFGGNCLYSCSQDGAIRSWILNESILSVPLPANIPGVRSPSDVPGVYDLCFGLAISPGNLAMAVAHSFDTGLLNPMYEARIQKAAVEFLWIGGQQLDLTLSVDLEFEDEANADFSKSELINWKHNILWSFKQLEHRNKPLVIWDIVAALLAFRESVPNYVANIILQWMRSLFGSKFKVSPAISSEISKLLSDITSRQLQVLNVICRRVLGIDQTNSKEQNIWSKLVDDSERELRERLFALNFSAILRSDSFLPTKSTSVGSWNPVGLGQMMQWVSLNHDDMKEHVKSVAEEARKIKKSRESQSVSENIDEERCSFCSAAVPFESAEVGFCLGVKNGQAHKLARCAVSMLLCPITPTWFCICCHRNVVHLAPPLHFLLPKYPLDLSDVSESCISKKSLKPLCPFCGILLLRRQPEYLLSPSPV